MLVRHPPDQRQRGREDAGEHHEHLPAGNYPGADHAAPVLRSGSGRRSDERIKALRAEVVSAAMDRLSPAQQTAVRAALPALEALRTELAAAVLVKDGARDSAGA